MARRFGWFLVLFLLPIIPIEGNCFKQMSSLDLAIGQTSSAKHKATAKKRRHTRARHSRCVTTSQTINFVGQQKSFNRSIDRRERHNYQLSAQAGQTVSIHLNSPSDLSFTVEDLKNYETLVEGVKDWSKQFSTPSTCNIEVSNCFNDDDTEYSLQVSLSPNSAPRRQRSVSGRTGNNQNGTDRTRKKGL